MSGVEDAGDWACVESLFAVHREVSRGGRADGALGALGFDSREREGRDAARCGGSVNGAGGRSAVL